MKLTTAQTTTDLESPSPLLLTFTVEWTPDDLVGAAQDYDEIIEFVLGLDTYIADSVFTEMLKEAVNAIE